jgi:putative phage-type endonuclease
MPKFVDLVQGSQEWISFRKSKITASEIATIMGINTFETPYQLWQRKLDLAPEKPMNAAMQRGKDLEAVALNAYANLLKTQMKPAVVLHSKHDWAMASLDGVSYDSKHAVEIKIMGNSNHEEALTGHVKPLYNAQMQWQMFCLDIPYIDYFAWNESSQIVTLVHRDEEMITEMIKKGLEFFNLLKTFTPPPLTEKDYIDRSNDDHLAGLMAQYAIDVAKMKALEKSLEEQKQAILSYCDNISTKCQGGKVTKIISKGRVQYDKIPEIQNIDLEPYRSKPSVSFRITV